MNPSLMRDPERKFRTVRGINETKKAMAITMWEHGADTASIAERLKVAESYIYNRLPIWMGRGMDDVG